LRDGDDDQPGGTRGLAVRSPPPLLPLLLLLLPLPPLDDPDDDEPVLPLLPLRSAALVPDEDGGGEVRV
jgi:hypothetical protein